MSRILFQTGQSKSHTNSFNRPSEELMFFLVKVIVRKSSKDLNHHSYGGRAWIEEKSSITHWETNG